MSLTDSVLRLYAQSGLRSIEGWTSLGRVIDDGATPRLDTPNRGQVVSLFTRDQTHIKPARPRREPAVKPVSAVTTAP